MIPSFPVLLASRATDFAITLEVRTHSRDPPTIAPRLDAIRVRAYATPKKQAPNSIKMSPSIVSWSTALLLGFLPIFSSTFVSSRSVSRFFHFSPWSCPWYRRLASYSRFASTDAWEAWRLYCRASLWPRIPQLPLQDTLWWSWL